MNNVIAKNIEKMSSGPSLSMISKMDKLRREGIEVIGFNVGEPDFQTDRKIIDAISDALIKGHTKYSNVAGILELREAIANKLKNENNIDYKPSQIVVSIGAKQSLYNLYAMFLNPNDEIIIPTPCWSSYIDTAYAVNATPVVVDTNKDFSLDIEAISKAITSKTKVILINSPNNPTGAVYDKASLEAVGKLAIKHNLMIISDEPYEKLTYGNSKHISIASISKEIYDHVVTVNGFSKTFAMTGLRIGYAAMPSDYIATKMVDLQSHMTANVPVAIQYGAIEALKTTKEEIARMVNEFKERRDLCASLLKDIEGVKFNDVKGAFYIMIDISSYFNKSYNGIVIKDVDTLAEYLLDEARIAMVSGRSFAADNYLRMSYTNSKENITKGLKAMKQALDKLK